MLKLTKKELVEVLADYPDDLLIEVKDSYTGYVDRGFFIYQEKGKLIIEQDKAFAIVDPKCYNFRDLGRNVSARRLVNVISATYDLGMPIRVEEAFTEGNPGGICTFVRDDVIIIEEEKK
jgi:hypothetical protein